MKPGHAFSDSLDMEKQRTESGTLGAGGRELQLVLAVIVLSLAKAGWKHREAFYGLPSLCRQGTGLLLPSLWAAYGWGWGKGGQRWLSHRAWGQNKVRLDLEPGPRLPIAWSLKSGRAVWRSSHLSFCFWIQPQQMASCRQTENPGRGVLSRNENSPAVIC